MFTVVLRASPVKIEDLVLTAGYDCVVTLWILFTLSALNAIFFCFMPVFLVLFAQDSSAILRRFFRRAY